MPESSTLKDYQTRFILLKEWKRKSTSEEAVKIINAKFGDNSITITKANYYYKRFDKGDISVFRKDSSLYISSNQSNNLQNNLFFMTKENSLENSVFVNGGRFLISSYCALGLKQQSYIVVHDLFLGKKNSTPVPFKKDPLDFKVVGEHLFLCKEIHDQVYKLHVFKINYNDLTILRWKIIDINLNARFSCNQILPNQLDDKRFFIWNWRSSMICQIQDNKIVMKKVENLYKTRTLYGKRFVGKKLHGFVFGDGPLMLKFCELNFETMENEEKSASIDLDNNELNIFMNEDDIYCWSKDCFYKFYATAQMETRKWKLLMFDSKTLKWTDIGISAISPIMIFVDDEEFLTLQTGNEDKIRAYYRIGLRKPDKLMNLTKLAIVKESTLYGIDKCIKSVQRLKI